MNATAISIALGLALLGTGAPAVAQPKLDTNETVFQSGSWFVVRATRARSDSVSCTGFYKSYRSIQLSQDMLLVKVSGGIEQIAIGFNGKLLPPRQPMAMENQLGAVVLAGPQFEQLQRSRTLRLEAVTGKGRANFDLKLQGLSDALANMAAGCPVPSTGQAAAAGTDCSLPLLARMRANGITEAQITASCR